MLIHFGSHPGSTGAHLAAAAVELGYGKSIELSEGEHLRLTRIRGTNAYLWVESGVRSLPLDTYVSELPTAGYLIDSHLHLDQTKMQAALFDVVFVAQRDFVESLGEVHPNVHWLPLAAPRRFLELPRDTVYPAAFVGAVPRHSFREHLLGEVNRRVAMNDWRRTHAVDEMGDVYRRSRIVLNPPARGDLNMRFFEGMACGAVVVTPAIGNGLDALAKDGVHYLAAEFHEPRLVADFVVDVLNRNDLQMIGAQARELIAQAHTYHHRISTIKTVLDSTDPVAPIREMTPRERARHLLRLAEFYGDPRLGADALSMGVGLDADVLGRTVRTTAKAVKRWSGRQFRRGVHAILEHRPNRGGHG